MRLSYETTIDAPADRVWEVVGHQFAGIDAWATMVTASWPSAEPVGATDAPVGSRICETGSRMLRQLEETIISYDEAARTLTYAVTGLPTFAAQARVGWQVAPVGDQRTRTHVDASMQLRGIVGLVLSVPLRLALARQWKGMLADLRHYVEQGQPSSSKRGRLAMSRR